MRILWVACKHHYTLCTHYRIIPWESHKHHSTLCTHHGSCGDLCCDEPISPSQRSRMHIILSCLVLSCVVLSCILFCPVLTCFMLFCIILSFIVLFYGLFLHSLFVRSCLALSCPAIVCVAFIVLSCGALWDLDSILFIVIDAYLQKYRHFFRLLVMFIVM